MNLGHSRFRASSFAQTLFLVQIFRFPSERMYEAIESGAFPKWEFAIQVIPASKEHDFDFDILRRNQNMA